MDVAVAGAAGCSRTWPRRVATQHRKRALLTHSWQPWNRIVSVVQTHGFAQPQLGVFHAPDNARDAAESLGWRRYNCATRYARCATTTTLIE